MTNEWNPDDIFEVWADERARAILALADREPRSAEELAAITGASRSAIYRRLKVLREQGLLEERVEIDEDGHHHGVYEPGFECVRVVPEDGALAVEVLEREDAVPPGGR